MEDTEMERLIAIMARLRDPVGGCPWDVAQNFATIAPYTIEEAYEVADAIERGDMAALADELGDLLFQVVYHARMAEEAGHFAFADVARGISKKMVRRHPHVFGEVEIGSAEAQTVAWEATKAHERNDRAGEGGVLDGVAKGLPALLRALKLQKRAARVGFDWQEAEGALTKLGEELNELADEITAPEANLKRLEAELGDVLFSAVNLARKLNIDAEGALRATNAKFERRFGAMEKALAEQGTTPEAAGLEEMEALWQEAKTRVG
jgi:MazG family protein